MTTLSAATITGANQELSIRTEKYLYTIKHVGLVDSNNPYKGWLTFDVTVGAITPKRGGVIVKNVIRGDLRTHPDSPDSKALNTLSLNRMMFTFILGRYTLLLEKNKKLTQEMLDDVVADYLATASDGTPPIIEVPVSIRSKCKSIKPMVTGISITRGYALGDDGVYRYGNTLIEAGSDNHSAMAFSVNANDRAAPLSSEGLQAVLMASIYKLTVDMETFTGLNPKAL